MSSIPTPPASTVLANSGQGNTDSSKSSPKNKAAPSTLIDQTSTAAGNIPDPKDTTNSSSNNSNSNNNNNNNNNRNNKAKRGRSGGETPQVRLSKSLSWLLRHNAVAQGIAIGADGFSKLDDVLAHSRFKGFTVQDVEAVVRNSDKKRFELVDREGVAYIRAVQGHSIKEVKEEGHELITDATQIPIAVHGTNMAAWELIEKEGLKRMNRNHIHMAVGLPGENGVISGMRTSSTVHIYIDTAKAMKDGIKFQRSINNVILSDGKKGDGVIPPEYFSIVKTSSGKVLFPPTR
ncbi:hypothetical protein BGW42_007260 [Actinomortierella wolfii]|nr:hypothetical protein BGW42_007260 [Actinomortierella wolfii]